MDQPLNICIPFSVAEPPDRSFIHMMGTLIADAMLEARYDGTGPVRIELLPHALAETK
jgi:hypothetical protein